jgi:hypothetical protein
MIGPDQDLSDFPVWIWPYIDVARLSRVDVAAAKEAGTMRVPQGAVRAHVTAIIAAAQVKQITGAMKDGGAMQEAAGIALNKAIDDCGNGRPKPWPHPPRRYEILEVAGELAVAAAAIEDKGLSGELAGAVQRLADRAGRA